MRKSLLKYIIPLLFALAVALGLFWSTTDNPFVFEKNAGETAAGGDSLRGFYEKSLALSAQNQNNSTATFLAVGDIMLSRNVASKIKTAGDPLLPFSAMTDVFSGVNFSIANLESPFSGSDYIPPTGSLVFNAPDENIKGLKQNKFKVVSLANNHALDQGVSGLERTLKFLDENGIRHIGAGMSLKDAWQPAIMDINGIKICFLAASYASVNDGGKNINEYVARIEDLENLTSSLSRSKMSCDFTVISMHAGIEYTRTPNQAQIDFAHAAIDAGADMVIGAHPHWTQTTEKYNGKYIFYSLGNFIFDQMWSQETREGLALKIAISKPASCSIPVSGLNKDADESARYNCPNLQGPKVPATLESIELIPIIIDNYSTPRPANEDEAKNILEKIDIPSTFLPLGRRGD